MTTLIGGHLSALPFAAAAVPAPAPGRQAAGYGDSLKHVYASAMEGHTIGLEHEFGSEQHPMTMYTADQAVYTPAGDAPADWASCAGCCAFCGLTASWDEAISALELPHPMLISRV